MLRSPNELPERLRPERKYRHRSFFQRWRSFRLYHGLPQWLKCVVLIFAMYAMSALILMLLSFVSWTPVNKIMRPRSMKYAVERLASYDPEPFDVGFKTMKSSTLVIAGIVQNARHHVAATLGHIRGLGALFANYRVLIIENDSTDGTAEYVQAVGEADPRHIVVKSFVDGSGDSSIFGSRAAARFEKIARYRNMYLELFRNREFSGADYYAVVDLDQPLGWENLGVAHSMGKQKDLHWDIVCANGIENDGEYYDNLAFRTQEINDTFHVRPPKLWFTVGDPFVPVESCFGGLAIYNGSIFVDPPENFNCIYGGGDCEHVVLHKCLSASIFINPTMVFYYGFYSTWIDYAKPWTLIDWLSVRARESWRQYWLPPSAKDNPWGK